MLCKVKAALPEAVLVDVIVVSPPSAIDIIGVVPKEEPLPIIHVGLLDSIENETLFNMSEFP